MTPTANSVIVEAVIDASTTDVRVIVQTTSGAQSQQKDVKGARLTITTPDARTLVGAEEQDTIPPRFVGAVPVVNTRYRVSFVDVGGVAPGGRYLLHITLPDGREVDGATTVPTIPNAADATRFPVLPDFKRESDTLSLTWRSAPGAAAYEVFVSSSRASFSLFADTSVALPGRAENSGGVAAFFPGLAHRVVVSAVDANYYDYYRRSSDFFSGLGIISRLDGAIGVFGSIAPVASYSFMVR